MVRLYLPGILYGTFIRLLVSGFILLPLVSCAGPQISQSEISVTIIADKKEIPLSVPVGSTAQEAYRKAGLSLSALDRSDPPLFTALGDGATLRIVRIVENFEVEQVIVPFQRQVVKNESLPVGESRLSQLGMNGLEELTYRILLEDGVEVSRTVVKEIVLKESVPEIILTGSQTPFLSVSIPGRLAYLSAGNAWVMEVSTGERRPVINTGDLDGRIFTLSPDKKWLLFTRGGKGEGEINNLWAAFLDGKELLVDLKAVNVIHFAGFSNDSSMIAYSTVEPRGTAPGWQANNDLYIVQVSESGFLSKVESVLETNSGGVYGWWGMSFSWSSSSLTLAYARPDSIGIVDREQGSLKTLLDVLPLQTGGDWAWVPGVGWSPDDTILYTVEHVTPPGGSNAEQSPQFDLTAILLTGGSPVALAESVGMFAYPVPSPLQKNQDNDLGDYQLAYLQAITPLQSETSRYRLAVMDRDGSNKRNLFPDEGAPGLEPQKVVWSPTKLRDSGYAVAFVYQNNIYLVDVSSGQAQQITGDGLVSRIDWR